VPGNVASLRAVGTLVKDASGSISCLDPSEDTLVMTAATAAIRRPVGHLLNRSIRLFNRPIARRSTRFAVGAGMTTSAAVLSFDCDTDEDIEVVADLHDAMVRLGVTPSYAVPGELLLRGADVYRDLAARGAEFLNHGFREHCHFDSATQTYVSSYFYDQLNWEEVEEDIRTGHEACIEVLGHRPTGFRTPHFGSFQRASQLGALHRLLAGLGYRFSSSTGPRYGFRNGPLVRTATGVLEVPVTGCPSAPLRPFDSWSFRFAPHRLGDDDDYLAEAAALVDLATRPGAVQLVNIYADPSQVVDWPPFLRVVNLLAPFARPSFAAVLDEVGR
jgi:peptidoglycan/xylan/chitin deacetylase (PgdA/CDA1 family)